LTLDVDRDSRITGVGMRNWIGVQKNWDSEQYELVTLDEHMQPSGVLAAMPIECDEALASNQFLEFRAAMLTSTTAKVAWRGARWVWDWPLDVPPIPERSDVGIYGIGPKKIWAWSFGCQCATQPPCLIKVQNGTRRHIPSVWEVLPAGPADFCDDFAIGSGAGIGGEGYYENAGDLMPFRTLFRIPLSANVPCYWWRQEIVPSYDLGRWGVVRTANVSVEEQPSGLYRIELQWFSRLCSALGGQCSGAYGVDVAGYAYEGEWNGVDGSVELSGGRSLPYPWWCLEDPPENVTIRIAGGPCV
jgi:hypothetical protein